MRDAEGGGREREEDKSKTGSAASKSELFVVSHRRKMDVHRSFLPTGGGGVAEGRSLESNENKAKAKQSPPRIVGKNRSYHVEG